MTLFRYPLAMLLMIAAGGGLVPAHAQDPSYKYLPKESRVIMHVRFSKAKTTANALRDQLPSYWLGYSEILSDETSPITQLEEYILTQKNLLSLKAFLICRVQMNVKEFNRQMTKRAKILKDARVHSYCDVTYFECFRDVDLKKVVKQNSFVCALTPNLLLVSQGSVDDLKKAVEVHCKIRTGSLNDDFANVVKRGDPDNEVFVAMASHNSPLFAKVLKEANPKLPFYFDRIRAVATGLKVVGDTVHWKLECQAKSADEASQIFKDVKYNLDNYPAMLKEMSGKTLEPIIRIFWKLDFEQYKGNWVVVKSKITRKERQDIVALADSMLAPQKQLKQIAKLKLMPNSMGKIDLSMLDPKTRERVKEFLKQKVNSKKFEDLTLSEEDFLKLAPQLARNYHTRQMIQQYRIQKYYLDQKYQGAWNTAVFPVVVLKRRPG